MASPRLPILEDKHPQQPSLFQPANLLREARRQRGLPDAAIPAVCLLDPDGDIVRYLRRVGLGQPATAWACYHTQMWKVAWRGRELGIVACAVGAPFAVLVAEQVFASGGQLLLSITSAGQLAPGLELPCFVRIERALRDEGTSYHYLPPEPFAGPLPAVAAAMATLDGREGLQVRAGAVWTTDAPYRETEAAVAARRAEGLVAVEMEAAALYAFSQARQYPVACFAHVTNAMAQTAGDFEKGEADGALAALDLAAAAAAAWYSQNP
ncbi:MAG: nucleoside phosphorylase [Deltaproteobacteria bacterium]|nr:nucleoside phosphorylase [Deltaproteobacteria bacterium]